MVIQQDNKIYSGYFPDFKFNDTILFWGSPNAFAEFAKLFRKIINSNEVGINFEDLPLFVKGNIDVHLKLLPQAKGMKRIDKKTFEWGLSTKECEVFADNCEGLSQNKLDNGGGHYYLDCDALDDVQVMASVGEYSLEFFKSHGDNMWDKTNPFK
jgi:hypothetical protein